MSRTVSAAARRADRQSPPPAPPRKTRSGPRSRGCAPRGGARAAVRAASPRLYFRGPVSARAGDRVSGRVRVPVPVPVQVQPGGLRGEVESGEVGVGGSGHRVGAGAAVGPVVEVVFDAADFGRRRRGQRRARSLDHGQRERPGAGFRAERRAAPQQIVEAAVRVAVRGCRAFRCESPRESVTVSSKRRREALRWAGGQGPARGFVEVGGDSWRWSSPWGSEGLGPPGEPGRGWRRLSRVGFRRWRCSSRSRRGVDARSR